MTRTGRLVVVGGGVIGTATAYYAARRGWQVTIVEKETIGSGCSHANCGYVSPSHALPLAGPGVLWPTLRTMFLGNSPLKIRFRIDPQLWMWLLSFAGRCNQADMLTSARAIHGLLQPSRKLYDELIAEENLACDWTTRGLLFVQRSRKAMEHFAQVNQMCQDELGLSAKRFDDEQLTELEPALLPGCAGGWLYECDAHLRPDRLMESWREAAVRRGVVLRERTGCLGFREYKGKVDGVRTDRGDLPADAVVLALGAWTPQFQSLLRCRIPIQPGKGYSITMTRPTVCPRLPMILEEHRVAITPFSDGYRIGSTMEFAGYDSSLNSERLELLQAGAKLYLRDPFGEKVTEQWWGWRPMTYDSVPILGPIPDRPNLFLATGHSMLGVSMATSSGRLMAELISQAEAHVDPSPYCVTRFG